MLSDSRKLLKKIRNSQVTLSHSSLKSHLDNQGEEWGDEQEFTDEDVPSEDEADDTAQDENSGRNID